MSPELFDPERFNLKDSRPTKSSDRYAFGMVMYEVLSGRIPFSRHHDYAVVVQVLKGERPLRPQGANGRWFTDDVWSILKRCWEPCPDDRPRIEDVLDHLEEVSSSWAPYPQITVDPSTAILPTSTTESSNGESPDECEASSPSDIISPQPSHRLRLEGNPHANSICPSAYRPSALSNDAADHCAPGTTVTNLGVSKESERIVDRVSLVYLFDNPVLI